MKIVARSSPRVGLALLLLIPLLFAPPALAGDEEETSPARGADPETIAGWILFGGDLGAQAAASALTLAPPELATRVIEALRAKGGDPDAWIDALIDEARSEDADVRARAIRRLAGFGEHGIRRLLARLERRSAPDPTVGNEGVEDRGVAVPGPAASPIVQVTVHLVTGPRGSAATLFGDARIDGTHLLDAGEARLALEQIAQREDCEVIQAPRLSLFDRQWGDVRIVTPVAYIKEFRIEHANNVVIADPVIAMIDEGLVFEIRGSIEADGRAVCLDGALLQTAVSRPIGTRSIRIEGGPQPVEIQVPEVRRAKLDLHITVADGGTVLATGLDDPSDADRELIVLVQPKVTDAPSPPPSPVAAACPVEDESEQAAQILIETTMLTVSPRALRRALGDDVPFSAAPKRRLTPAQVRALMGADGGGADGVAVVAVPSVVCLDGLQANIRLVNQVSYVQDYEVEVGVGGSHVADPIIGTVTEGLVVDVLPRLYADGTTIGLKVSATYAEMTRPIAEFTTRLTGSDAPVTIQIPEVRVSRIPATVELGAGRSVLVGGFGASEKGVLVLLLRAYLVTDADVDVDAADAGVSEPEPGISPR